jgi:hypothetical protein
MKKIHIAMVSVVVLVLLISAFVFFKRTNVKKEKLSPRDLTAAITNISAIENPMPTTPKQSCDSEMTGAEADSERYVPGFYKIQKKFPSLTKRKLHPYNSWA